MNHRMTTLAACIAGALASLPVLADGTSNVIGRDVNQQERIEQGLQSGRLSTREAGKLERDETHIDKMESNALADGTMSKAETARIENVENKTSSDIYQQKHDTQLGNPEARSSQRMQTDVQRNVNQQTRIENGVRSGELTAGETSKVEGQQARVDHREAHAAQDGHVGAGEQARIQRSENHASNTIHRKKHNAHARPGA
jgi:hypothetical protein